jgi:hypothetical protein
MTLLHRTRQHRRTWKCAAVLDLSAFPIKQIMFSIPPDTSIEGKLVPGRKGNSTVSILQT